MSDRTIALPWDGTDEAFAAIQALMPGAWLLDDEAVTDYPLVVHPDSGEVAFPGDTVVIDLDSGKVTVIEGSAQDVYERERSRAGADSASSPSQQR
jgi:hypothetical protein